MMSQMELFGLDQPSLPTLRERRTMRVLITVTAAPNPSAAHGETVCVAGLELGDSGPVGWVRLYPLNLRHLRGRGHGFRKYDIVELVASPARHDGRTESWSPEIGSIRVVGHLNSWDARRQWLEPLATDSMCGLHREAKTQLAKARSLGLAPAAEVFGLDIAPHPGWSADEQAKIDAYVNQLELFSEDDKVPLRAPRVTVSYRWRCSAADCQGTHRQRLLDWEVVAFERHFPDARRDVLGGIIERKFLGEVCAPERQVSFFVGNQAKRPQTFSILGIYWPRRSVKRR
ncbi:hypothetical protein JL108_08215 [Aeromicrobium sp. YIM 150415]|uniref:hypothetical protein n=1 Tax=Aeromicrobium sp. YIM 150415 TaxID=2803912 RepID=UPI0019663FD3|nr:hypothetical protein [Aeromicrobium sp. YIM 150415]MBM9463432.1 hypothetical protein [Aeromicrobium sp. YIM 150415]